MRIILYKSTMGLILILLLSGCKPQVKPNTQAKKATQQVQKPAVAVSNPSQENAQKGMQHKQLIEKIEELEAKEKARQLATEKANKKAIEKIEKLEAKENARQLEAEKVNAYKKGMEDAEAKYSKKAKEEVSKLNADHAEEIKDLSRRAEESERKAVEQAINQTETRVRLQMWTEKNQDVLLVSMAVGFVTIVVSALGATSLFNILSRKWAEKSEAKQKENDTITRIQNNAEKKELREEIHHLQKIILSMQETAKKERNEDRRLQAAAKWIEKGHEPTNVAQLLEAMEG